MWGTYYYDGLIEKVTEVGINAPSWKNLGISSRRIAKIGRGEPIATHVLRRVVDYLECSLDSLYSEHPSHC